MEGWPRKKRVLVYAGAFSLALFCGLFASYLYERVAYRGQVLRGVQVEGRSVAFLDRPRLVAILGRSKDNLGRTSVELSLGGKSRKFKARELGVSLALDEVTRRILGEGRRGSFVSQFGYWLSRLVSQADLPMAFTVDQKKLQEVLSPWAKELLDEPVLPSVTFDGKLVVEKGRGGTVLEYDKLAHLLKKEVRARASKSVSIPTRERPPVVDEKEVARARGQAEALLEGPIEVVAPENKGAVTLTPSTLGAALTSRADEEEAAISLEIDTKQLKKSLKKLLDEVESEPVEAGFQFSSAGVPTVTPSESGRGLDDGALSRALLGIGSASSRSIALPISVRKPKLTTEQAEKLGVKGLVMSFTTRHACCQPRVQNIHHAAAKLDGLVLRPGERFSLNEFLGPRRKATGYHKAPTIVRGEMEEVYGGGISQLATTLFNAVLRGGYQIIQRQPHSVYFSRYPEGHEATVSFPEPDLIFRNDTEAGMVIKTQAESTYIRVLIFGDNGGRVTTIDKGKRYDIVEPPKEYEPDEDMPPEKVKRLRAGQLGWKVLVSRKVKFPSGEVKEEKREVVYNPRPELLRVHPCVIPEGEEGHTGEECPEPEIIEEEEELSEDVYYETL